MRTADELERRGSNSGALSKGANPLRLKANFLIQILLPTRRADGEPVSRELFQEITSELTHRFGGLTAYTRSPAEGLWKDDGDKPVQDEIVIY